jgi:hypothetical protein
LGINNNGKRLVDVHQALAVLFVRWLAYLKAVEQWGFNKPKNARKSNKHPYAQQRYPMRIAVCKPGYTLPS